MSTSGNMQHVIDHAEQAQQRRRNLLARYPDVSEVDGEYHARSAAADAQDVTAEEGVLVAYVRLADDGMSVAGSCDPALHIDLAPRVRCGGMPISEALHALREKHPDAWAALLAIVKEGNVYSGKDDLLW